MTGILLMNLIVIIIIFCNYDGAVGACFAKQVVESCNFMVLVQNK